MSNPINLPSNPASDLSKQIIYRLRQGKIDDQILEVVQQVFDKELDKNHVILSHPEKVRLFRQSLKVVLSDLLVKIDSDK